MANNSSWFLGFLSGQINEASLKDKEIFNELKTIQFELDDIDDLMSKETIRTTYKKEDGSFDERTFKKEYEKTKELFKLFELDKFHERAVSNLLSFIGDEETGLQEEQELENLSQINREVPKFQDGNKLNLYEEYNKPLKGKIVAGSNAIPSLTPYQYGENDRTLDFSNEELALMHSNYSLDTYGNRVNKAEGSIFAPVLVVQDNDGRFVTMSPEDYQGNVININESITKGFVDINKDAIKQNNEAIVVGKIGAFGAKKMHEEMNVTNFAKRALVAGTVDLLAGSFSGLSDVLRNTNLNMMNNIDNFLDSAQSRASVDSEMADTFSKRWWFDGLSSGAGQIAGVVGLGYVGAAAGLGTKGVSLMTNGLFTLYGSNTVGDELRKAGYNEVEVTMGQLLTIGLLSQSNRLADWITAGIAPNELASLTKAAVATGSKNTMNKGTKQASYQGIKTFAEEVNKSFKSKVKEFASVKGLRQLAQNDIVHAGGSEFAQETLEGLIPQIVIESQELLNKTIRTFNGTENQINVNNKYLDSNQSYLENIWKATKSALPEGVLGAVTGGGTKTVQSVFTKKSKENKDVKYLDVITLNGTDFSQKGMQKRYEALIEEAKKYKEEGNFFSKELAITDDFQLIALTKGDKQNNKLYDINSSIHDTVVRDATNAYNYLNFLFDKNSKDIGYQKIQDQFQDFARKNKINNKDFNAVKLDYLRANLLNDANNAALADILFYSEEVKYAPNKKKGKITKDRDFSKGIITLVNEKNTIQEDLEAMLADGVTMDAAIKARNTAALDATYVTDSDDVEKANNRISELVGGELKNTKAVKDNEKLAQEKKEFKELHAEFGERSVGKKNKNDRSSYQGRNIKRFEELTPEQAAKYKRWNQLKFKLKGKTFKTNLKEIKEENSAENKIKKARELLKEVESGMFNHEFLAKINFTLQKEGKGLNQKKWTSPSTKFGTDINAWDNFLALNETSKDSIIEAKNENAGKVEKKLNDFKSALADRGIFVEEFDLNSLDKLQIDLDKGRIEAIEEDPESSDLINNLFDSYDEQLNQLKLYNEEIIKANEELDNFPNRAYLNRINLSGKSKHTIEMSSSTVSVIASLNQILSRAFGVEANLDVDDLKNSFEAFIKLNENNFDKNWTDPNIADIMQEMAIRVAQVQLNNKANQKSVDYNTVFSPITDKLSKNGQLSEALALAEAAKLDETTPENPLGLVTMSDEEASKTLGLLNEVLYELKVLKKLSDDNIPDHELERLKEDALETKRDITSLEKMLTDANVLPEVRQKLAKARERVDEIYKENEKGKEIDFKTGDKNLSDVHFMINEIYKYLYDNKDNKDIIANIPAGDKNELIHLFKCITGIDQNKYQETIKELNKEGFFDKAPSYIQAKAIRLNVGAMMHPNISNKSEDDGKALTKAVLIKGIQGSGKSSVVLKGVAFIYNRLSADTTNAPTSISSRILAVSSGASQTSELLSILSNEKPGSPTGRTTINTLLDSNIAGNVLPAEHTAFLKELEKADTDNLEHKIIILDEATLLEDKDCAIIKKLSSIKGIKFILAGDIQQVSSGEGINSNFDPTTAATNFTNGEGVTKSEFKIADTIITKTVFDFSHKHAYTKPNYDVFSIGELNTTRRTGNGQISDFIAKFREEFTNDSFNQLSIQTSYTINEEGGSKAKLDGAQLENLNQVEWERLIEERIKYIEDSNPEFGTGIPLDELLIIVPDGIMLGTDNTRILDYYHNHPKFAKYVSNIKTAEQVQGKKAKYTIIDPLIDLNKDEKFKEFIELINQKAKVGELSVDEIGFGSPESLNYHLRQFLVSAVGRTSAYTLIRHNSDKLSSVKQKHDIFEVTGKVYQPRMDSFMAAHSIVFGAVVNTKTEQNTATSVPPNNGATIIKSDFGLDDDKDLTSQIITAIGTGGIDLKGVTNLAELKTELEAKLSSGTVEILSTDLLPYGMVKIGDKEMFFKANENAALSRITIELPNTGEYANEKIEVYIGQLFDKNLVETTDPTTGIKETRQVQSGAPIPFNVINVAKLSGNLPYTNKVDPATSQVNYNIDDTLVPTKVLYQSLDDKNQTKINCLM